jgi:putative ABC transport system permease protein
MVDLARKTIIYEWRRFMPAVFSVAASGVLLFVQAALAFGMFETISVYIRKSGGDLWITSPATPSIDQGRPLDGNIEAFVRMNVHVTRVEPFSWGGGVWRSRKTTEAIFVYLTGVDPADDGLVLSGALPLEFRRRLKEPFTVVVDLSEREKLDVELGDTAEINGIRVKVVGFVRGMRALGAVNVIASLSTARRIDTSMQNNDKVAYFVAKVDDRRRIRHVQEALSPRGDNARYEALTANDFADRTTRFWILSSGMGVIFIVSGIIVFIVSFAVTSQTLMAAVAASVPEYATLRALGVPLGELRRVVLRQAAWIGGLGLAVGAVLATLVVNIAAYMFVPVALDGWIVVVCAALLISVAFASGVAGLTQLSKADPAALLR